MTRRQISVIVSTYNRADILRTALLWLNECDRPERRTVEVVVVDNNSTDSTSDVVAKFKSITMFQVQYVFEPRQGLGYARNAGIESAQGDLLVFTDDDCFVCSDWLVEICREFDAEPGLAGLGGRVDLYDERDLPITIRTSSTPSVARPGNLFSLIPGCNMCFRRSIVDEVGMFDTKFGAGTKLYSAEDSDYVYRVIKAGGKVSYVPRIRLFHAHGRRTDDAAAKLARGYMVGRGGFYCKFILAGDTVILRHAYWELRNLILDRFRGSVSSNVAGGVRYLLFGMLRFVTVSISTMIRRRSLQ